MTGFRKPDKSEVSKSHQKKQTDKKQMTAFERWEIPAMVDERRIGYQQINASAGFRYVGIKPPTAQEVEEIRKNAYEEGFKEGKEKGFKTGNELGLKKGEEEKKAETAQLAQVARALMKPIDEQDQALEKALLAMVMKITKIILKRELKIDSSQVIQIVREAVKALNCGDKNIKIYLNPKDLAQVVPELKTLPDYQESWRLVEKPGLSPGGCIVESSEGLVDASVDRRVEQVVLQIYEEKVLSEVEIEDNKAQTDDRSEFLDDE